MTSAPITGKVGAYVLGPPLLEGKETYIGWRQEGGGEAFVLKAYTRGAVSAQRRAEREWEIASRLGDGIHLPRAIERAEDSDRSWLVFEVLPGLSLRELLSREGAQEAKTVRLLGTSLARALAVLHAHGLAHADISPSNCIVMDSGEVGLCDFGEATDGTDVDETLAFTPGYCAPERMQGRTTPQSDLYSLGAVLYEAWTGRRPDEGPPRDWPARCDDLALRRLITRCMHPVPAFRPRSDEVAQQLARPPRWLEWRPSAVLVGLLCVAVLLLAVDFIADEGGFVLDHDRDWTAVVRATGPVQYYLAVPAKDPWFTTGLNLEPDDTILIQASGEAGYSPDLHSRVGPEGDPDNFDDQALMPSAPVGALIGRIGQDGEPFLVGRELRLTVESGGILFLSMNDRAGVAGFHDNEGRWSVYIQRPAP